MNRLFKGLGILLGFIVVVVVAGSLLITRMVDPNQFKPLIISQFKQFSGFDMTIPGQLSWSFYPNFGMSASEVTVSDAGVFTSQMNNIVMRARVVPLRYKQLDLSKVSIQDLRFNQIQASNVQAQLKYVDQVLSIQPISAKLYQGDLNGQATVSLSQASPVFHLVGTLNQVDVASLLKDLAGKTPKLDLNGLANISWDVTTQGKAKDQLLSQLNGRVEISIKNGVVKGMDLAYFVNTAAALINKEPLPERSANNQTEFGNLSGIGQIKDGVMTTNNLTLESPTYHALATGTINLVSQDIDYHVDITSKVEQKTNKILALYGKAIPVRVTGSLSDPSVTLDTLALMREVGKEQLQRVGQQIQQAIPEKANNFIKSLFH